MSYIITPVALVAVIGALAGLILAIASKVMHVHVDEKVEAVIEALPGANCGACGFAGCTNYAEKLVQDPELKANLCVLGGEETTLAICDILGVAFEKIKPQYAVAMCSGRHGKRLEIMEYQGITTCEAAKQFFGGFGACKTGCMGFGDCIRGCPNDAIEMTEGVARIDRKECIGCGLCVTLCPNNIIKIIPDGKCVVVACNCKDMLGFSKIKGCKSACVGCKKCMSACENGAISIQDKLATIDYDKCINCGKCFLTCPTRAIKFIGKNIEEAEVFRQFI